MAPESTRPDEPTRMIGLIRVSTGKQAESGLGLEAQQTAIEKYRNQHDGILIRTYKEVESGGHDKIENRPQLLAAVGHAKRAGATLVIAKQDRLLRSVSMLAYIKNSNVKFVSCDNPYANELTVDLLCVVASNERRMIKERTKTALSAYKSGKHISKRIRTLYPEGVPAAIVKATAGKLGGSLAQCRNLTDEARVKGLVRSAKVRKDKATEFYAGLVEPIKDMWSKDRLTLKEIAAKLNEDKETTRNRKPWNPVQVKRVLNRAGVDTSRRSRS
jgi:DNA invertase Pin-like site-specific DNA recombinase